MRNNLSTMAYFEILIFLCSVISFVPSYCKTETENSNKRVSLPKFLTEVDLSSVDASAESNESLKRLVKRLAPEKNGEYQVYQVFFGNPDLLKEWLKGAGVTGQPGVDFPALTTIPATSFSCRGLKGGYYADLETNCQVFHICDNGRKISFLCPNGTIFQQSQLICDWWFKVDCSKSAELYEQSSEQLLEEERRRAESRKAKLDYRQSIEAGGQQDYFDVQNLSYDGKQNGRIKTYEEPPLENQVQDRIKTSRYFDGGNNFSQENGQKDVNQFFGNNGFQNGQVLTTKPPLNQFTRNTDEGNVNKYSTTSQDFHGTPKKAQNYHVTNRNSNNQEKGASKRLKFKSQTRNSTAPTISQRVTPSYTESTTFRASSPSPIKESQQVAESAAFVGNRGNRFVDTNGNSHQYYYQSYNRETTARSPNPEYESTTATTERDDTTTQRLRDFSYTDATSTPYYETTTPYFTTTVSPPCNDEATTDESATTNFPPTTESLRVADTSYDFEGNSKNSELRSAAFSDPNYYNNGNSGNGNEGAYGPSTTRSQPITDSYRRNTVTSNLDSQTFPANNFSPAATTFSRGNNFGRSTEGLTTRNAYDNQYSRAPSKNPSTASPGYRQNFIGSSTEKPYRTTPAYQQNTVTEKDLSPYDRSFTYKQGKVLSTLGPYVPFTRSYATTVTSTPKPTPYTPTIPTHTAKTLIPKLKYPAPTSLSKLKSTRFSEREHALSMLHSLKNLENNVPSLTEPPKPNGRLTGRSGPLAPSPLHSLALFFTTTTDNSDNSNESTDSSVSSESGEDAEKIVSKKSNGTTIQVPPSLLTRHTIDSYTDLFNLNDAFENNVTTEDRLDNVSEDYNENLEPQESGGSLDDLRKSNSTRLREIAQVFTQALSAYLLNPDSFKRVLTEIRPTEPPKTTLDPDQWKTTTDFSLTSDYTASIREKDEVLSYSDDGNNVVRQKLTTVYPTTFEPPTTVPDNIYDILSTQPSTYYTTPRTSSQETYEPSTNFVTDPGTNDYYETSLPPTETTIPAEHGSPTYTSSSSGVYNRNNEVNNYVCAGCTSEAGNQNRVGGFQNNSISIVTEPYREAKSVATTPISDNFVVSPTPSSPSLLSHMVTHTWSKKPTSRKPEQQLTPPFYESYAEMVRKENERTALNPESYYSSTPMPVQNVRATTTGFSTNNYETPRDYSFRSHLPKSEQGLPFPMSRTSYTKFRTSTPRSTTEATTPTTPTTSTTIVETTPCTHTESIDSFEATEPKENPKILKNDHWTSSPAVTQLWETTVFVDPRRINHGLESDVSTTVPSVTDTMNGSQESLEYGNSFLGDESGSTEESSNESEQPAASQRLSRNKDTPTSFSLLPTTSTVENTATPKPLFTTRSSIIATITSSITSTNPLPRDTLVTSLLPYTGVPNANTTENEIAENLFGKLNATSSNALMRVMKQADNNETVRQLVLLLVRHCKDPVNKTMQREKEELLNALLKLPVNEFASEESRNIVAGINELSVSPRATTRPRSATVKSRGVTVSPRSATVSPRSVTTSPMVTEPIVTTYRSRKSRKFRTTTENSANLVSRSEKVPTSEAINSLQEDQTAASDGRALELLRSLYTIATKWG